MSTQYDRDKEELRAETVEVLLAQLQDTLDKQFHAIDGLDQKAGISLGSASLVVALIGLLASALLQKTPESNGGCAYMQWAFVIGAALYIGVILCVVRAFSVETYYLPVQLDADVIRKGYLGHSSAEVREQLVADYIEHCSTNAAVIAEKAKWIQSSLYLLAVDTAYLTIVVIAATLTVAT
jgi:hypothetical protein